MCCDALFNRELSPALLISVREPVGARKTNPDVTVFLMASGIEASCRPSIKPHSCVDVHSVYKSFQDFFPLFALFGFRLSRPAASKGTGRVKCFVYRQSLHRQCIDRCSGGVSISFKASIALSRIISRADL